MKINLNGKSAERWETVRCGGGEFEVLVRSPTYQQQSEDANILMGASERQSSIEFRIETAITDWRGLLDENDEPIPFHHRNVAAVCGQYPAVFRQLAGLANDAFRGLTTEDAGNSESPSSDS